MSTLILNPFAKLIPVATPLKLGGAPSVQHIDLVTSVPPTPVADMYGWKYPKGGSLGFYRSLFIDRINLIPAHPEWSYPCNSTISFLVGFMQNNVAKYYVREFRVTTSRNQYTINSNLLFSLSNPLDPAASLVPAQLPGIADLSNFQWLDGASLQFSFIVDSALDSYMFVNTAAVDHFSFSHISTINSATATPTSRATSTPTPTHTATPTKTGTPRPTYTQTPTKTVTPTPTKTRNFIVPVTPTSTPTRTAAAGLTPTPTLTRTVTPTRTPQPSNTQTPTKTPTRTATPNITPTRTAAAGLTPTPTPTCTVTPTRTPGNTSTPTQTPTHTPSSATVCISLVAGNVIEMVPNDLISPFSFSVASDSIGRKNPCLIVERGKSYTISVDDVDHPFFIKTNISTGSGGTYNDGITNNGANVGDIQWTVACNAPSTLFYNCGVHSSMHGTINVIGTCAPTPTPTSTVTQTPSRPAGSRPGPGTWDTTSFAGWSLYVTKCAFPIYVLFRNAANIDTTAIADVKEAMDRWSCILATTGTNGKLPGQVMPSQVLGIDEKPYANPLAGKFTNDGYVLVIDQDVRPPNVLAAAGPFFSRSAVADRNTRHFNLPSMGVFGFSKPEVPGMLSNVTLLGKRETYYVSLHEVGHALGLGTSWFDESSNAGGVITTDRNFVVTGDDFCPNPAYNTIGNIFYTIDRGSGTDTGTYQTPSQTVTDGGAIMPGAVHRFAFNPFNTVGNTSRAVAEYNICFGTSLTAIPLENAMSGGSYGAHWAEGFDRIAYPAGFTAFKSIQGLDARQWRGAVDPGAPCLQDELMTPMAEGLLDLPVSKITLGALEDLGYGVDMSQADPFTPLTHTMKLSGENLITQKCGFGPFLPGGVNSINFLQHLRRGLTYTFINQTGADIIIRVLKSGATTIDPAPFPGVTKNADKSIITVTVPRSFTDFGLVFTCAAFPFPKNTCVWTVA